MAQNDWFLLDSHNFREKTRLDGAELPDYLSTANTEAEGVKHFSWDRALIAWLSLYSQHWSIDRGTLLSYMPLEWKLWLSGPSEIK